WVKKEKEPARPMPPRQLARERAALYLGKVTSLLALRDPGFELTPLGTTRIHGHEAVGLRVRHAGRHEVRLYFDRQTWLLVKAEQDLGDEDDEMTLEVYPGKYEEVQDVKEPMRVALRYGDMPYAEYHHTGVRLLEGLDEGLFAMPETATAGRAE